MRVRAEETPSSAITRVSLAALFFLIPVSAASQGRPADHIAGGPSCSECRIQRYLLAELNDDSIPGAIGFGTAVTVLSDQRFFISGFGAPTPFLANRDGWVARTIGRDGSGPGEYRYAKYLLEIEQGFLVGDTRLKRMTRLSPEFEFEASAPLPTLFVKMLPAAFGDGTYLVFGDGTDSDGRSHPAHIVAQDGSVRRSFGAGAAWAGEDAFRSAVTVSGDSTLLIIPIDRYRIERWDSAGNLLRVYERPVNWFPPGGSLNTRRIVSVHEDAQGLVWVQLYQRSPERVTFIEVLDLERLRVVATARIDDWMPGEVRGGPYAWTYEETAIGEPRMKIWGFRLHR